jgi:hypothetical protein
MFIACGQSPIYTRIWDASEKVSVYKRCLLGMERCLYERSRPYDTLDTTTAHGYSK